MSGETAPQQPPSCPTKAADERTERLARALRANLRKRKDQARARAAAPPSSEDGAEREESRAIG